MIVRGRVGAASDRTLCLSGASGHDSATSNSNFSLFSLSSPTQIVSAQQNAPFPAPGEGNRSISFAGGTMNYSIRIVGPDGNVPILVQAHGSIGISPNSAGFAGVQAYAALNAGSIINDSIGYQLGGFGNPVFTQTGSGQTSGDLSNGGVSGTFVENSTYEFATNTVYNVSLQISVYGNIFSYHASNMYDASFVGGSLDEHAFIDPTFTITSGVDSSLYSLELSAGVGNIVTSGVPESSTWLMILLGFGGLGCFAFHKARKDDACTALVSA